MTKTKKRLEYLRGELRAERISYGEISELQSLAPHIAKDDVELLEAAGVPEHPTQDKATARPWQTYNETCVSSCGAFPRFVAQTMLDDEDTKLMSQKEVAAEQQRAEADAALIVRAVNEHSALVAVAEAASKLNWNETNPFRGELESAPFRLALGKALAALCLNTEHRRKALKPLADTWEELPAGLFNKTGTGVAVVMLTIQNKP